MSDTTRLATALGDRYVIERELGAGGMATVYLAKDLKHDREVALKVLRPELGAVLGPDRFLAEIKITARLDHPHILTLIDSGAVDGLLFYVLPFVRGESLRHKLEREKQLGIEEALGITRQIASALDYAHQHGVVHRDIKPENILLHEGEAVLADFGIALAVKEAGGNRLTETGLSLGTPQYMSPEQATGDRTLDARSDLYSLAAVLYEMLTGEPPVTGATAQAMIAKLMTERPTRIRSVRDTVPEGIDNAVAKALSKVPADRFASAGQFVQALQLGGRPSQSAGAPRSKPRTAAMIALVAAVAAVAASVAVTMSHRGGTVRTVQPDRAQLTFSGNAWTGGMSPDGQRIAYSTRQCTPAGYCTFDVVVQDVGGAGTSTVLHNWASIWDVKWSHDGRYLLVNGFQGLSGNWGPFAVPSLGGGQVRFLGCCGASLGDGDTALVAGSAGGDSLVWIRFVTLADGAVHDSLPVRRVAGGTANAYPLAGNRLLVKRTSSAGVDMLVMERNGQRLDSLRFSDPKLTPWLAGSDGTMFFASRAIEGSIDDYSLLTYAVAASGRIRRTADTVIRQMRGDFEATPNGALLNVDGPTEYEVWMMQRDNPSSMRFTQRKLVAGTAPLGGSINLAGSLVALWRRVLQGGRSLSQMSLMPADSGAETLVGPPLDVVDYEWTASGDGLVLAIRRGRDSVDIVAMQLPGGRRQTLATLAASDVDGIMSLGGGGVVVVDPPGLQLHLVGVPGRTDTLLTFPDSLGSVTHVNSSPDGHELLTTGWDRTFDTIVVRRISLHDGAVTRMAGFYADGSHIPAYLPGGAMMIPIRETSTTVIWYLLPASGGRPVRLGSPPRAADATFRMSADGRRVIARVRTQRPDIYLIRNFSELLPH